MRRVLSIFLSIALGMLCLAGCANPEVSDSSKIKVVATIFPEYDWVCSLADGTKNIEILMLNQGGVDLHSFQPTAEDLINLSSCDVLIYTGGESEKWIYDALKNAVNKDMRVINLLECIGTGVFEEETVEGMEEEAKSEEESEEEFEYDEHVWLSLKNADIICSKISEELAVADPSESQIILNNCSNYSKMLKNLDAEFAKAVEEGSADTLVFGDRFPFRYMVEDYGLNYYAAFPGCSAESEAGFETILFLGEKLDELGLGAIIKIDGSDDTICHTIIENSSDFERQILTLNSMQSVSLQQAQDGMTYLGIMQENLVTLKEALK